MRHLLIILLAFLISGQIFAKCSSSGIWAYPSKSEISQNSIIVVEGYARSQRIIDSLNIGYPIYLESDGHKVRLNVNEIYVGMFSLTQAFLQPEQKLIPGKTYRLKIDNLSEWDEDLLSKWNSVKKEYEPISWTVKSETDTEIPNWKVIPKLVDKTTKWYGCGPAIYAVFNLQIEDSSQVLIKTELTDMTNNKTNTYYLTIDDNGKLNVGHGMCSGAFDFKAKHKYKIRFNLTDVSGNINNKWTDWVSFDSPFEGYE